MKYKIIKSVVLAQVWLCLGVTTAILTPSMLDMTELLQVNIAQLSVACLVSKSIGMLLGSPLGGMLADKYRRHQDMLLAVEVGVMCLSIAAVPWAPNLLVVGLLFALSGFTHGGTSATGNAMILTMWGREAASPLQFIHGSYGVGLTVTPLFTAPFLSKQLTSNTTNEAMWPNISSAWFPHKNEILEEFQSPDGAAMSKIYIPYGICGLCGVVASVALLVFYFMGPPQGLELPQRLNRCSWREILHPASFSAGNTLFGMAMVTGLFFMYIGIVSKDRSLNSFITTYAVEELNMTKSTASILTTTYFATYTFGRYASMILAICLPIYITLFGALFGNLAAALSLILVGLHSVPDFWVLSLMFGFFAGPVYPAGLVWADRYIEVTAVVVAVIDLGISLGIMISSWLGGYLYQYIGHIYVIEITLYFNIFTIVMLIMLQLVAFRHGLRWRGAEEIPNNTKQTIHVENEERCKSGDSNCDEHSPLLQADK